MSTEKTNNNDANASRMRTTNVAMSVAVGGLADVPMVGNLVQAVGAEIKAFYDSKQISDESCAGFLESIEGSRAVLNQLDENEARDLSEHRPVRETLEKYKGHMGFILEQCDKWASKPLWMKYKDGRRYASEFDGHKKKLDDIVRNLQLAITAQLAANMNKRFNNTDGRLDSIKRIASTSPPSSSPPSSSLPETIELIGREEELTSLANSFRSKGAMASLSGGGGMGKSQIAKTFARGWYEADEDSRFVWWIASETEAGLRSDYLEMLDKMGETVEEEGKMTTSEIATFVWKKLSSLHFDWLLVFDNVPEANGGPEGFKPLFFPTPLRGFNRGRMLFTSRSELFAGHTCIGHVANVNVEPLPESAAVEMLLSDVPVGKYDDSDEESERAAALRFARQLGCLPLALATVSGYVLSRGITVKEYLDEFESYDVTEAVSKALQDALAYARDQGTGDILDIAAFVDPDSIPLELLGGENVRGNARHLCGMSILRRVRRDVYSVHQLHQEVLREGRSSAMAVNALNGILESFDMDRSETWQVGRLMYLHIDAVEKHAKCTADQEMISLSRVLEQGGNFLCNVLNDFNGAEAKLSKALAMKRHVYGEDTQNDDLAGTLNNLANLHCNRGEYDVALAMYEEALMMYRHVYGDDGQNADVAKTLNNIGTTHGTRGEYDQALAMYEEALAMYRQVYGADAKNADLALTLNNIGEVYRKRGEYDKALAMYEEALAMQRHVYGDDARNAVLANALNNIGVVHHNRGEYDKALALYEEALAMYRHVYGDDAKNAVLARTLHNIANVHRKWGEYDVALAMYEEALAMQRHVYGDDARNANLANSLNNIGVVHYDRGEYDKALAMYEEVLAMQHHMYGDDAKNAELARTLNNIANLHRKRGEYDKALVMFEEALAMYRHVYGDDAKNTDLANTLNNIGTVHDNRVEYDKALTWYEEARAMQRHVYGDDAQNADVASTLSNIAILHCKRGKYDKALAMYEKALAMQRPCPWIHFDLPFAAADL